MNLRTTRHGGSEGRARGAGFTLVELMVVVVIVGVLAAVGLVALRRHAFASKTGEALAMIQSIRAAQERYRSENLVYLDVTEDDNDWYPKKPVGADARKQRAFFVSDGDHNDAARWRMLNPTVPGPVQFAYMVNAGLPAETMTAPSSDSGGVTIPWPDPPAKHWYVIEALANVDADADYAYFIAGSLQSDVFRKNEGE